MILFRREGKSGFPQIAEMNANKCFQMMRNIVNVNTSDKSSFEMNLIFRKLKNECREFSMYRVSQREVENFSPE